MNFIILFLVALAAYWIALIVEANKDRKFMLNLIRECEEMNILLAFKYRKMDQEPEHPQLVAYLEGREKMLKIIRAKHQSYAR